MKEFIKIKNEFCELTSISLKEITINYLESGEFHKPTNLQEGKGGVYIFLGDKDCLKVGKAGQKSKARWSSQHYGFSTPSTLAKSFLANKNKVKKAFFENRYNEIENLNKENVGKWIKENTHRVEFIIFDDKYSLNLLEALVQFRLKPIFEGR